MCNRLKPYIWHWIHWKGPIDPERKYRWNKELSETEMTHTLPSTAPEKFLDIFYYYHFLIFFNFKFLITPLIFIFKTYYFLEKKKRLHFLKKI